MDRNAGRFEITRERGRRGRREQNGGKEREGEAESGSQKKIFDIRGTNVRYRRTHNSGWANSRMVREQRPMRRECLLLVRQESRGWP